MDVVSGTPVSLWVDFEGPQGLLIPDVDTLAYSLYDGAGQPLAILQALTPGAEATGVAIPIAADRNLIAPGQVFARRQVLVTWISDSRSYSRRVSYRVVPLPLYATTADDVRTYLSLNSDELRDDEIDLFAAFLAVAQLIGADRLATALAAGDARELAANRAITYLAAQALFPSLRYRIAQSKKDSSIEFQRLKDTSAFDSLVAETGRLLALAVTEVTGTTVAIDTSPTLVRLVRPTNDPVTGEAPAV